MSDLTPRTAEILFPEQFFQTTQTYLLSLKLLFAYETAAQILPRDGLFLEVGCGPGYGTSSLSRHASRMIGLDVNPKVIQYASNKYSSAKCAFQLYDGLKIPYPEQTFDAVVSFQVLEHIQDDRRHVQEIHRVLKTGGSYLLTTPNGLFRLRPNQKPWNRFHLREYAPAELNALLKPIFADVRVWGIRGNAEIQDIEHARIMQAQRLAALVPFNLRRFIPPVLETRLITWFKQLFRPKGEQRDFLTKYHLHDYAIVQDDLAQSLDLLAIAQKT